ncbi:MAG: hypothetical protein V8R46_09840 [Eubacterium ramulus]
MQRAAIISTGDVIRAQDLFMHDRLEKVEQKQESYRDQVDLKMEVARFEAGYLDHAFPDLEISVRRQRALEWTVLLLSGNGKNMSNWA